jgi:hypothetical protein
MWYAYIMDKRIAIILTSIERPLALHRCLESIVAVWQDNWVLMIGLQDDYDSKSFQVVDELIRLHPEKEIRLYDLEYDCGISVARNELIQKAYLWNIPYVLLTADSITLDESMKRLQFVTTSMGLLGYKLCGLNLNNRIPWEANLDLIDVPERSFVLDFIDPKEKEKRDFVDCDIVRNFWVAKTEALVQVPYDEQLIMAEHEDFFWRFANEGFPVCCTNICSGTYNKTENTPEYDKIRNTNFRIGMQRLINKYSLKHWVCYKHLERTSL